MASRKATTDRGFSSLTAAHEKICASFLGPRAENHQVLYNNFATIAGKILEARERFFPNDPVSVCNTLTELCLKPSEDLHR